MGQSQTWNGNVLNDAGNVASDVVGFFEGPPGDPGRIRACADQVDALITRFDADHRGLNESVDELTTSWSGDGATQFRTTWYGGGTQVAPDKVLSDAHAKLSGFSRNLRDYADQLEHAQNEHWIQMEILVALTVLNAAQLGADPATNAAEVGVATGAAVGSSFALADIGALAIDGAFIGFGSDVVSQLGADLMDRLDPAFDSTGDHAVALFNPEEAVLSGVIGAGSGVLFGAGARVLGGLLTRSATELVATDAATSIDDIVSIDGAASLDPAAGAASAPDPGAQSNFMAPGEQFAANASKTEPLDGYHDVISHGSPVDFGQTPDAWLNGRNFDHRAVARLLAKDPNYTGGPVRLIACNTGGDGATAAQNLANKLGTEVLAPTDKVWAFRTGRLVVGPDWNAPTGGWTSFFPKRPA